MSHLTQAPVATPQTASATRSVPALPAKHSSVVFTEKQVLFSTAAAGSARSAGRPLRAITLTARLGRMLTALTQRRPNRACPEPGYLERARMAREMERL